MSEPTLVPSVERPRKRRTPLQIATLLLGIGAVIGGISGAVIALLGLGTATPTTIVVRPTEEVLVPSPVLIATPPATASPDTPCPARYLQTTNAELESPDDNISRVTASWFDTRRIAVWSDAHVYVSSDEGRSFTPVLDGDAPVVDAAFDCHGRLHVLRNDGALGVYDGNQVRWGSTHEVLPDLADAGDTKLVPHDGGIAVITQHATERNRLVIARRDGERWTVDPLLVPDPRTWVSVWSVAIEPRSDGRIRLLVGTAGDGTPAYTAAMVDLHTLAVRSDQYANEQQLPSARRPMRLEKASALARDAADRWIVIYAGMAPEERPVRRLTAAQATRQARAYEKLLYGRD
jgi:hypothetical protein